jgi:predicted transcriptional regulator
MKKLIISLKTPGKVLEDFEKALIQAHQGKRRASPHYEVSFDNRKDFERFVRNMSVLVSIQQMKPVSVNELSKMLDKDQSTLNKLIIFFEQMGVVKIVESKIHGRAVKTPKVEYDTIEFRLAA